MKESDLPKPGAYYVWHFRVYPGPLDDFIMSDKKFQACYSPKGGITMVAIYEYNTAFNGTVWDWGMLKPRTHGSPDPQRFRWGISKCHLMDSYCKKTGRMKALFKSYSKKGWTTPFWEQKICANAAYGIAKYCWNGNVDTIDSIEKFTKQEMDKLGKPN